MTGTAGSKYGIINDGVPTTARDNAMRVRDDILIMQAEAKADATTIHWLKNLIAKYGGTCAALKCAPDNIDLQSRKSMYERSLELFIQGSDLSGCPALRK